LYFSSLPFNKLPSVGIRRIWNSSDHDWTSAVNIITQIEYNWLNVLYAIVQDIYYVACEYSILYTANRSNW
jgi:hypothetical protein